MAQSRSVCTATHLRPMPAVAAKVSTCTAASLVSRPVGAAARQPTNFAPPVTNAETKTVVGERQQILEATVLTGAGPALGAASAIGAELPMSYSSCWPPPARLRKPHEFFPFDLFSAHAADGLLSTFLEAELSYVKDHCMVPPYPWGQVVYHDFIVGHLLDVPGAFAEFGVGQGGTTIFLARLAKRYGRKFLAVDSFQGLPAPDMGKDNPYFLLGDYRPFPGEDNYTKFLEYKRAFDVDDVLYVEKAFFKDVEIPKEFDEFAFVHLDSDLYESVFDSLRLIWPLVSRGGCVAVDDFFHHAQGPARAVSDFFRSECTEDAPPMMFVVPTYAVLIVKGLSAVIADNGLNNSWRVAHADALKSRGTSTFYTPRALDGNFYSFALARSCQPLLRAAEASAKRVTEALELEERVPGHPDVPRCAARLEALRRTRHNSETFLAFLRYPESAPRSGLDIFRYLSPLEDLFDISQGALCGVPGEGRSTIEIRV